MLYKVSLDCRLLRYLLLIPPNSFPMLPLPPPPPPALPGNHWSVFYTRESASFIVKSTSLLHLKIPHISDLFHLA